MSSEKKETAKVQKTTQNYENIPSFESPITFEEGTRESTCWKYEETVWVRHFISEKVKIEGESRVPSLLDLAAKKVGEQFAEDYVTFFRDCGLPENSRHKIFESMKKSIKEKLLSNIEPPPQSENVSNPDNNNDNSNNIVLGKNF